LVSRDLTEQATFLVHWGLLAFLGQEA
jgi:hypothetical protein